MASARLGQQRNAIHYEVLPHSHQHCICESQNNKTQVPCCLLPFGWGSRGTGFIMEYAFVCGGSAGELCLSCAAPIVIETSVMNKTCDPVSIRVQGFDPEFRVPGLVFVAGGGGHFKLSGIPDGPRAACCRKRHHGVLQKRFEIYIMFVIVAVVSPSFRLNIVWVPLSYRCPPEPAFSLMDLSVALLLQALKTLWLFVSASHGQYNRNEATSRRKRAHRRRSFWWDCGGFACPRVGLSDEGNQIDQEPYHGVGDQASLCGLHGGSCCNVERDRRCVGHQN